MVDKNFLFSEECVSDIYRLMILSLKRFQARFQYQACRASWMLFQYWPLIAPYGAGMLGCECLTSRISR